MPPGRRSGDRTSLVWRSVALRIQSWENLTPERRRYSSAVENEVHGDSPREKKKLELQMVLVRGMKADKNPNIYKDIRG